MADSTQIRKAKLKLLKSSNPDDELIFPLNPDEVQRSHGPRYAEAPIAGADYSPVFAPGVPPPFQWISNRAEEIRIGFLLVPSLVMTVVTSSFGFGSQDLDVETELAKLDRFMRRDGKTGEPPDLVFTFGDRIDRVRIWSKDVVEKLWTAQLKVQKAQVHLTLRAQRSRSS